MPLNKIFPLNFAFFKNLIDVIFMRKKIHVYFSLQTVQPLSIILVLIEIFFKYKANYEKKSCFFQLVFQE